MQVPTVDYSPIARANAAKSSAMQASYAAKDASLFKIRHQRNLEAFEIQKDSIELGKWQDVVSNVLNAAELGISAAESFYKIKLSKQEQEGQQLIDSARSEYQRLMALHGDDFEIVVGEDGQKTIKQPQALTDFKTAWEKRIGEVKWLPEMEGTMKAGLQSLFADIELGAIQGAAEDLKASTASIFQNNYDNAMRSDIVAGVGEPLNTYALIDGRSDLSDVEKQAWRSSAKNDYQTGIIKNDITRIVNTDGYDAAVSHINSLDRTETEKMELREFAMSADQSMRKDAASVGQAIYESNIKGLSSAENIRDAYESVDDMDISEERKGLIKDSIKSAHAADLQTQIPGYINDAANSQNPYEEYERLEKRISEGGDLHGYFMNQENLLSSTINELKARRMDMVEKYGKAADTVLPAQVRDLTRRKIQGLISDEDFAEQLLIIQEPYQGMGIDSDKIVTDALEEYMNEIKGKADPVATDVLSRLRMHLGWPDENKMNEDTFSQYIMLKQNIYADVAEFITSHQEGWDSAEFNEFVDGRLLLYDDEYFDLMKKDPDGNTLIKTDYKTAGEILTSVFTDEAMLSLSPSAEIGDSGMIRGENPIRYGTPQIEKQVDDSIERLRSHFNADYGYSFVGHELFIDGETGRIKIGFKDAERPGYFMYDPETGKLSKRSGSEKAGSYSDFFSISPNGKVEIDSSIKSVSGYSYGDALRAVKDEFRKEMGRDMNESELRSIRRKLNFA